MSVYDIADHPDFRFRTTDIVIRIGNTEDGALPKEDEVGMLLWDCSFSAGSGCGPSHCHQVLQELRPESLTVLHPRMVGVACIREGSPLTWRPRASWTLAVRFPGGCTPLQL